MRLPKPKLMHPPEVYAAIVQDHHADPVKLAQTMHALGWSLADAAWASANWSPEWMAAAIASEKQKRGIRLHTLSDAALEKLKVDPSPKPRTARKTNRITSKADRPKEK